MIKYFLVRATLNFAVCEFPASVRGLVAVATTYHGLALLGR